MSDTQAYEEVTISSDGIAVVKRFEDEEFPVPAIAFDFESDREESVTVTMSDTVPDGIEVEDLGFHPEYGSEFWTIDDETITFERELEAGESYTTVYGIRATGSDDVRQFLTEPTLESVEPPLPEGESSDTEDILAETDSDVVRDAISGDGEIPGLEEETEESEEVATLELNDPNGSGTVESNGASGDGTEAGTETETATETETREVAVESGNLTAALATEIREQNVSGEDLKLLRRALEMAEEADGSDQARLDQLQDDIADLRAYTGALEEFLDENGTGEQLIEGFEEKLDSFEGRLDSISSETETNSSRLESVDESVSAVDEEVDSLGGELEDVGSQVDSVEEQLDELETTLDELEERVPEDDTLERIDEMEETLDDLQSWQEQIKQTFGG